MAEIEEIEIRNWLLVGRVQIGRWVSQGMEAGASPGTAGGGDGAGRFVCVRAVCARIVGRERENSGGGATGTVEITEGDEGGECKYLIINKSVPN